MTFEHPSVAAAPMLRPRGEHRPETWAVGGGKGGIGKSIIAANLAICLSRMGRKVLLVDADIGGANLHTCLGLETPRVTLLDYISRRIARLEDVLIPTGIPGLILVSGAHDLMSGDAPNHGQSLRFLQELATLPADYIILDLGAGTQLNVVDFFIFSDHGILVVLPEPTAVENAYTFLKNAFYRKLRRLERQMEMQALINRIMRERTQRGIRTPAALLQAIKTADPQRGMRLEEELTRFRPKIVVNQARSPADAGIGPAMQKVCRQYFGIGVEYLGCLEYDERTWMALRRKRPVILEFPDSQMARNVVQLAGRMVERRP